MTFIKYLLKAIGDCKLITTATQNTENINSNIPTLQQLIIQYNQSNKS
jgi:hypothetical protein